jgi:hypothetical protein
VRDAFLRNLIRDRSYFELLQQVIRFEPQCNKANGAGSLFARITPPENQHNM